MGAVNRRRSADHLVTLVSLTGKVVSGMGNFSYWIEKLHDHYLRKTGMHFFPGTLNIELDEPWSVPASPHTA